MIIRQPSLSCLWLLCPAPTSGPTTHSGAITADETWTADTGPHNITGNLTIKGGATVTIEPCVVVQLSADVAISVGSAGETGHLVAEGDSAMPIVFKSSGTDRWESIFVEYPGTASFAYVEISNGGSNLTSYDGASLVIWGDSQLPLKKIVSVNNVVIDSSAGVGVLLEDYGAFTDLSDSLVVTACGQADTSNPYPVSIQAQAAGSLPSGSYIGNETDAILLSGSPYTIEASISFPDPGVDYHLKNNLLIKNDATLTISSGVNLLLSDNVDISIGTAIEAGGLVANGISGNTVTFTSLDSLPWGNINVESPSTVSLTHTTLENGGGDVTTYDGASLVVYGDSQLPVKKIATVSNLTISNSAGYGVLLNRLGGFTDVSTGLTITGSGARSASDPAYLDLEQPVRIQAQSMGTLPSGIYTGNATDEIYVNPIVAIKADVTVNDRGVPYHIDGTSNNDLNVYQEAGGLIPTLTLEPGVMLKFDAGISLTVGFNTLQGTLRALGSPASPVVFTSATDLPAAGDWIGLYFDAEPGLTGNSINHARIEYAGGPCSCGGFSCEWESGYGDEAAILILGWRPGNAFVTNTTISNSAGHGINRGWTSDSAGPDFVPTNTFNGITQCDQTTPMPATSPCPQVSCP